MPTAGDRRPLSSRDTPWAQALARRIAAKSITPNQISQASMAAAGLAGAFFWLSGQCGGATRALLLVGAALFCQLRLLCNLFDGMVAIEGRKSAADGAFWNEFPDRVADLLIFVGAGYGIGAPWLGWAAAALAIFTAYVRELGRATGLPSDFSGPMAKQHRMAVISVAAVASVLEPIWNGRGQILALALGLVAIGAAVTVLRRSIHVVKGLNRRALQEHDRKPE